MMNWCMWIWKRVLWRELLGSYWGQKPFLARARSTFPEYVLGRAGLSDVVQASDLSNKALPPWVSRLQMAIKPEEKFYLRSLTGTFKPPPNSSVVPMKALRKRPPCPQILGTLLPFFLRGMTGWQRASASARAGIRGCVRARSFHPPHAPTVTAHAGESLHRNRSVSRLTWQGASNTRITALMIYRTELSVT